MYSDTKLFGLKNRGGEDYWEMHLDNQISEYRHIRKEILNGTKRKITKGTCS